MVLFCFPLRKRKTYLKEHVLLPVFRHTENILAIDIHTWHQPIQDRFLYLYIKIQKKIIKYFKNVQSSGEKLFISQGVLIWY